MTACAAQQRGSASAAPQTCTLTPTTQTGNTRVASTLCCPPQGTQADRYRVPLGPPIPRFEHQLSISVSALVQALQLLQVDLPIQTVLQAPLRGLMLTRTPAALSVSVAVTVAGHRAAQHALYVKCSSDKEQWLPAAARPDCFG